MVWLFRRSVLRRILDYWARCMKCSNRSRWCCLHCSRSTPMYTYTYIFVHTPRQFDNDKEVSDISYGCIPHTKILLYTMHAWWYRGIKIVSNIRNPFNAIAYNGWALNYCSECILDEFQQNEVYNSNPFECIYRSGTWASVLLCSSQLVFSVPFSILHFTFWEVL